MLRRHRKCRTVWHGTARKFNRITCGGRAQGGVSGRPAGAGEAVGGTCLGGSRLGAAMGGEASRTVLDEPGRRASWNGSELGPSCLIGHGSVAGKLHARG